MTLQFQKATRLSTKLKLAIAGPSGSGKTLGALALAKTLADGKPVAVIDTENGSASLYADRYEFDTLNLAPPFTSARYIEAMQAAVDAGYAVLVIDSLTHQWNGPGGILPRKEEMDKRPGANSYTNWATFTKEHTEFMGKVLHLPVHVIATMRSKMDYIIETNERGKQQPRKLGLAPVQRDGVEYEFSAVFDVQMDHKAAVSKDRTGLFDGELIDLVKPATGKTLLKWLASGAPDPATTPATDVQLAKLKSLVSDPELIGEAAAAKVTDALASGITQAQASKWITSLEKRIADALGGAADEPEAHEDVA